MSKHIHYITPIAPKQATGLIAEVYAQIQGDFGAIVEPVSLHAPSPEVLAGAWSILRESLVAKNHVERGVKESIAAAISTINQCPWCVDAHTMMMYATGHGDDTPTSPLIEWAKSTRTPDAPILRNPPFSTEDAPEIIGTAVTFHYITRMVTVLLSERFLPTQAWLRTPMQRTFGWLAVRLVRSNPFTAGASAKFLPSAPLPEDFQWAKSTPHIADAFARFTNVIDCIENDLPIEIQQVVKNRIALWNGETLPLSRKWVEEAINTLSDDHKPAARLALLTALAPHQVDEGVITQVHQTGYDDARLINILAWASFTAARRIARFIAIPEQKVSVSY